MPPKAQKESKKTETKRKEKTIEDKTFGLKNKKGAKQQKFVDQVSKQVLYGNQKRGDSNARDAKKEKLTEKQRFEQELSQLFKPVQATQKLQKGADPKSVLCAFFKQGQCSKGGKCKFSHDLTIERKAEKRNMYDAEKKDEMLEMTEEELNELVEKKHGQANRSLPPTSIVCKHFLDAVENTKYGWFWECPGNQGGKQCHYKHALPPGYVLKKDRKKMEEQKEDEISMEELVENERAALVGVGEKLTYASFCAWKKRKLAEKKATAAEQKEKRKTELREGRGDQISGREMFEFNPNLVTAEEDDDGEGGAVVQHTREIDEDDVKELSVDALRMEEQMMAETLASQAADAGDDRSRTPTSGASTSKASKGDDVAGPSRVNGAVDSLEEEGESQGACAIVDAAPIDEGLFLADDLGDLDISDEDDDTS